MVKLVPIQPTNAMVINGFEAVGAFRDTEECKRLSGCEQAATEARVCYEAMVKAAPGTATQGAVIVPRETLEVIYAAMNHMGDVLNNMDAVDEADEDATDAAFEAIRALLGMPNH